VCSHTVLVSCFFFSSRRRHTRFSRDWSSDVCSSDLLPTDTLEINVSGDYTSQRGEAGPTVLVAAGAVADNAAEFDPNSSNPATNANGGAWLPGTDGLPVPVNCAFVPAGPYSCDNLTGDYGDPGYISYANFLDAMVPTSQAPFKPYSALQNTDFTGWGVHANVTLDVTDDLQLVWIGSWREDESKWCQEQEITSVPMT